MHIQNIASCIDFVKATCFRLDKAFSKASLRFLHSSLVSTKPLRSFVEVAGFEVESAQPFAATPPRLSLSALLVWSFVSRKLFHISNRQKVQREDPFVHDIICLQEIGGVGFSCFF